MLKAVVVLLLTAGVVALLAMVPAQAPAANTGVGDIFCVFSGQVGGEPQSWSFFLAAGSILVDPSSGGFNAPFAGTNNMTDAGVTGRFDVGASSVRADWVEMNAAPITATMAAPLRVVRVLFGPAPGLVPGTGDAVDFTGSGTVGATVSVSGFTCQPTIDP